MTVHVDAVATLWEDLLARSPLPPRVGGVTGTEYELARLLQGNPVRTVETLASETWIWSDLHLRPGALADRMLRAWTNSVAPTDLIICLGDVAHREAFEDEDFVARVRACPGRRLLVLGNHDLEWRDELRSLGFEDQVTAAITATDPPIALTHVPLSRIPPGAVHAFGHLHGTRAAVPRRRDVGVDVIGLAPLRLDRLLEDLAAEAQEGSSRPREGAARIP